MEEHNSLTTVPIVVTFSKLFSRAIKCSEELAYYVSMEATRCKLDKFDRMGETIKYAIFIILWFEFPNAAQTAIRTTTLTSLIMNCS